MNLGLAVRSLDELLQTHFAPREGNSPQSVTLYFDSGEKANRCLRNLNTRMRGLGEPLYAEKVPPYPEPLPQLRQAFRDFIAAIPEGRLNVAAARFLNVKWVREIEESEKETIDNGQAATHLVTLYLTPYQPSWLAAFQEHVEETRGLPVVSEQSLTVEVDAKSYKIDDIQILRVIQLLGQKHPAIVKGAEIERRIRISRGHVSRVFKRRVWKGQPRELTRHVDIIPRVGFRWVAQSRQ